MYSSLFYCTLFMDWMEVKYLYKATNNILLLL